MVVIAPVIIKILSSKVLCLWPLTKKEVLNTQINNSGMSGHVFARPTCKAIYIKATQVFDWSIRQFYHSNNYAILTQIRRQILHLL